MQAALLGEQQLGGLEEEFEPRLLDVPALQFAAVWFQSAAQEYFISLLDGTPPGTSKLMLTQDIVPELRARMAARSAYAPAGGSSTGSQTN
jgi:hypothetical protein